MVHRRGVRSLERRPQAGSGAALTPAADCLACRHRSLSRIVLCASAPVSAVWRERLGTFASAVDTGDAVRLYAPLHPNREAPDAVKQRRTLVNRNVAAVALATTAVGIGVLTGRVVGRTQGELSGFRSPEAERRYIQAYELVLAQWPVPYEELTIPTSFGDTQVVASGDTDAQPLVLLHATGTSSTGWLLNIGRLSSRHRVFAVDIIGEAGKSKQTRLLRDRRDCVQWLASVLDGLGLRRTHVAGWSFGGWTALAFTIDEPQRVDKTVLLAPFGSLAPYAPAVLIFLKIGPYLPMGPPGSLALRMMSPGYQFDENFARQFILGGRYFKAADPRVSVFPKPFTEKELRSIGGPVQLMVGGGESTFDPHRAVNQAQRCIPDLHAQLVPDVGHMIAMEAADLVNDRMLRFLSD